MRLHKARGIYHAQYTGPDGKTKSVTTKCRDKEEAKRVIKTAGFTSLETAAKAARFKNTVISQLTTGRKVTMDTAIAGYHKVMQIKGRKQKTIHNNLTTLNAWLRDIGMDKSSPLALTAEHVDMWINDKRSPVSAGTRTVNLATIRSFLDFLCDKGWLAGNPANLVSVKLDHLSHEQKEPAEREAFTTQEIKRLLGFIKAEWDEAVNELAKLPPYKTMPPHELKLQERIDNMRFWDFAVRLSHETGLRLGDICGLEWRCFEKPNLITVWMGKTGKRLEIPVSDALLDLVANIPVTSEQYVFPAERAINRDPKLRSLLSVRFRRLCIAAGVKVSESVIKVKKNGKVVDKVIQKTSTSFHCLRHTLASSTYSKADKNALAKQLAENLTLGQIQQLLGHASIKTSRGYVHE